MYWAGYDPRRITDLVVETFSPQKRDDFFGTYDNATFVEVDKFLKDANRVFFADDWRPHRMPRLMPGMRRLLARAVMVWKIYRNSWAFKNRGIFQADGFENWIDTLLKEAPKLSSDFGDLKQRLTFRHVRSQTLDLVPLFLPVTDVSKGTLRLVSSINDEYLDLPIARAVRASAGFPIFFRPIKLEPVQSGLYECCIDGGVISNFPAWVFDQAFRNQLRAIKPSYDGEAEKWDAVASVPWHHIALRLPHDDARGSPTTSVKYLLSLWSLLSGLGRTWLEDQIFEMVPKKRFTVRPDPPTADAVAGVLDFDALRNRNTVNAAYERGRTAVRHAINSERLKLPPEGLVTPILKELASKAETALLPVLADREQEPVRTNIFLPFGNNEFKLTYRYKMDSPRDIDRDLTFRRNRGVTGLCYRTREPILCNLESHTVNVRSMTGMDPFFKTAPGWQPIRIREGRNWLLSVPIIDVLDAEPRGRRNGDDESLVMDIDGPIYGVVNVDAKVIYGDGFDARPVILALHPAVRLVFDAAKTAASQISLTFNRMWIEV